MMNQRGAAVLTVIAATAFVLVAQRMIRAGAETLGMPASAVSIVVTLGAYALNDLIQS